MQLIVAVKRRKQPATMCSRAGFREDDDEVERAHRSVAGGRFCAGGERQREEWPGWAALAVGLNKWRQAQYCFLISFLFLN